MKTPSSFKTLCLAAAVALASAACSSSSDIELARAQAENARSRELLAKAEKALAEALAAQALASRQESPTRTYRDDNGNTVTEIRSSGATVRIVNSSVTLQYAYDESDDEAYDEDEAEECPPPTNVSAKKPSAKAPARTSAKAVKTSSSPSDNPVLRADNLSSFQSLVLQSPVPVAVVFEASWCPHCKRFSPVMDKVAARFGSDLRVVRVDVDQAPAVASRHKAGRGVPETVVFDRGSTVSKPVLGFRDEAEISSLVKRHIRKAENPAASSSPATADSQPSQTPPRKGLGIS